MPIDTRADRQAAHRCAIPWARIMPNPDGAVNAADRAHAAGYFGAGALSSTELLIAVRDVLGKAHKVNILGRT